MEKEGGPRTSHDDGRLPEEIRFAKFCSISWTHDSKGFFYQVRKAIQNVMLPPHLPPFRDTRNACRTEMPHPMGLELKRPATSTPNCITIESALHSVSVSSVLPFRDVTRG